MACKYTYNGKNYSLAGLKALLAGGEYKELMEGGFKAKETQSQKINKEIQDVVSNSKPAEELTAENPKKNSVLNDNGVTTLTDISKVFLKNGTKSIDDAVYKASKKFKKEYGITPEENDLAKTRSAIEGESVSIKKRDLDKEVQKLTNNVVGDKKVKKDAERTLVDLAKKSGKSLVDQAQDYVDNIYNKYFDKNGNPKKNVSYNPSTRDLAIMGINLAHLSKKLQDERLSFNKNNVDTILEDNYKKTQIALAPSEAGRAFRFRQTFFKIFDEGNLQMYYRQISRNNPFKFKIPFNETEFNKLTPEQQKKVKPIYDKLQKYKDKLTEVRDTEAKNKKELDKEDFQITIEKEGKQRSAENISKARRIIEGNKKAGEKYDIYFNKKRDMVAVEVAKGVKEGKSIDEVIDNLEGDLKVKDPAMVKKYFKELANPTTKLEQFVKKQAEYFENLEKAEDSGSKADVEDAKKKQDNFNETEVPNLIKYLEDLYDSPLKRLVQRQIKYAKDFNKAKNEGNKEKSEDIKKKMKELTKNEIPDLLKNIEDNETPDATIKRIADRDGVTTITPEMVNNENIREFVNKFIGEKNAEDILDAAHEELQKILPDATRDDLRDAYTKSGEFEKPTEQKIKTDIQKGEETIKNIETLKSKRDMLEQGVKAQGSPNPKKALSDYEKGLQDEIDVLNKKISDAESQRKKDQAQQEKIDEYKKRIEDIKNYQKFWEKVKKDPANINQELADIKQKLRDELDNQDLNEEKGSKFSQEQRDEVIKNHNKAVQKALYDIQSKGVNEDGTNKEISEELENAIQKASAALRETKINETDAENKQDKIDEAIDKLNDVLRDNPENANEIEGVIENLYNKNKEASDRIDEDNAIKNLNNRKKQAERNLKRGNFDNTVKKTQAKRTENVINADLSRKRAEQVFKREQEDWKEANKGKIKRQSDMLLERRRLFLISGIYGAERVGAAGVLKPTLDIGVRNTAGRIIDLKDRILGIKPNYERQKSDISAEINSFKSSLVGMSEAKARELVNKTNAEFDSANDVMNDVLEKEKDIIQQFGYDSEEHSDFKNSEEFGDAMTAYEKAKIALQKQAIYTYLSGDAMDAVEGMQSLKNRWEILKTGSSSFEESRGGYLKKSRTPDMTVYENFMHNLEFFGRIHAASKDISARQALIEHWIKGVESAYEKGEPLTDADQIVLLERAHDRSFLSGKFSEANLLAEKIRSLQQEAKDSDNIFLNIAGYGSQLGTLVLKIPLNIAKESIGKYTFGSLIAIGDRIIQNKKYVESLPEYKQAELKGFKNTLNRMRVASENLPPEVNDRIKEYASKGLVGAAMITLGAYWASTNQIGYDEKRHKILWNGKPLGKFTNGVLLHTGVFTPLIAGAIYAEAKEKSRDKSTSGTVNTMEALGETLKHLYEESPIGQISATDFSQFIRVLTTISITKDIGEYFDKDEQGEVKYRKADYSNNALKGLMEDVKLNTGIKRQEVKRADRD